MTHTARYIPWLWFLIALFVFRVTAQLVVGFVDVPGLPAFERWHSGTMPYALLLTFQCIILAVMIQQTLGWSRGRLQANRFVGRLLFGLGLIYLGVMVFRLVMGLTLMTESRWFTNYIPTFFHVVLASFVLLLSVNYQQRTLGFLDAFTKVIQQGLPWAIYPGVLSLGLGLHWFLLNDGKVTLAMATYVPIILGALIVTGFEIVTPHRTHWQPNRRDVTHDALYMGVVQLILPKVVSFAFVLLLIEPIQALAGLPVSVWPHQWPIMAQAVLMIFAADFLRYWLHRWAHTNQYLWRLHAVHHSPEKLYWFNVARFHPLEKTIQMLFDTLPFMVLGVSAEVIAVYYVFYAINGFFQHSNIRLQFGGLNYLVSSAHLHRWHHSKLPVESNTNYGNNLIVWDLLFGTYFLPKDRDITILGLQAANYPQDFAHQLIVPFQSQTRGGASDA